MQTRIFYIGLDPETLELLSIEETFKLIGTARIENFYLPTRNPISFLFRKIYSFREAENSNRMYLLERFLLYTWTKLHFLSKSSDRRYLKAMQFMSDKKIPTFDLSSKNHLNQLIELNIDLIIVNSWSMLDSKIFSTSKSGAINIHPSLLPKYRGALPTLWTIKNFDKKSALTYFILEKGMDTGKIIGQFKFNIKSNDNWLSVEKKISHIIRSTLVKTIKRFLQGEIKEKFQNNIDASTTEKYEKYREINFLKETPSEIFNKTNLYPYIDPETYCFLIAFERKIYVKRCVLSYQTNNDQRTRLYFHWFRLCFTKNEKTAIFRLFIDINFRDSLFLITKNCVKGKIEYF